MALGQHYKATLSAGAQDSSVKVAASSEYFIKPEPSITMLPPSRGDGSWGEYRPSPLMRAVWVLHYLGQESQTHTSLEILSKIRHTSRGAEQKHASKKM